MDQKELEALLASIAPNGQTVRLEHTQEVVTRKVKRKVPSGSQYTPDTEEDVEVRVPVQIWTDRGTGRTLKVEVNENGTYTKVFDGIDPKMQGDPSTKPNETAPANKKEPVQIAGKNLIKVTETKDGNTEVYYTDPQGNRVEPPIEAGKDKDVGSRTVTEGGKTTKITKYERPDGTTYERTDEEIKPGTATAIRTYTGTDPATNKPAKVTEHDDGSKTYAEVEAKPKYAKTEYDKERRQWWGFTTDGKWEQMEGGPGTTSNEPPASVGMYRPDATKDDWGLTEFSDRIRAEWQAGRLPHAQAVEMVNQARELATSYESMRRNRVIDATNVRTQDIGQRNADVQAGSTRYSTSGSMFNQAVGSLTPFISKAGDQGALFGPALASLLRGGSSMAAANAGPSPAQVGYSSHLLPYAPTSPAINAATGTVGSGTPAPGATPAAPSQSAVPIMPTAPPSFLQPPGAAAPQLDADGTPRVYTPASATNAQPPVSMAPQQVPPMMQAGSVPGYVPPGGMMQRAPYNPLATSLELLEMGFDHDVIEDLYTKWNGQG